MSSVLNALNSICVGWKESGPNGMICNADQRGGIIDKAIASGEWFVIFNDERDLINGLDSRDDAIEAFAAARHVKATAQ